MAQASGFLSTLGRAIGATARGAGVALPAVLTYAILFGVIELQLFSALGLDLGGAAGGQLPKQSDLITWILSMAGLALGLEVLFGPLFAAMAVYVGRAYSQGSRFSLYQAVNFALNRYGRMFLPHLAAQLSIQLGMIIIVPGVLFLLQYAFVDPVAALEQEKSPLTRSKKLTRGRRRSLFLLILPWLILGQAVQLLDLWALEKSPLLLIAVHAALYLLGFIMSVSFYLLYEERTQKKKATPRPEIESGLEGAHLTTESSSS